MRPDQMRPENSPALRLRRASCNRTRLRRRDGRVYQSGTLADFTRSFGACLRACGFGEADGGDRRQREGDARHATIVRPVPIAFQEIGSRPSRHGSIPASAADSLAGRITRRIDRRIGDALQKFVQDDSPVFDGDPAAARLSASRSEVRPAA